MVVGANIPKPLDEPIIDNNNYCTMTILASAASRIWPIRLSVCADEDPTIYRNN